MKFPLPLVLLPLLLVACTPTAELRDGSLQPGQFPAYVATAQGQDAVVTEGDEPGPDDLKFTLPPSQRFRAEGLSADGQWVKGTWAAAEGHPWWKPVLWIKNVRLAAGTEKAYLDPVGRTPLSSDQYVVRHQGVNVLVLGQTQDDRQRVYSGGKLAWVATADLEGPRLPQFGSLVFPNNEKVFFNASPGVVAMGLDWTKVEQLGGSFVFSGVAGADVTQVTVQQDGRTRLSFALTPGRINLFEGAVAGVSGGYSEWQVRLSGPDAVETTRLFLMREERQVITQVDPGYFDYEVFPGDVTKVAFQLYRAQTLPGEDFDTVFPDNNEFVIPLGKESRLRIVPEFDPKVSPPDLECRLVLEQPGAGAELVCRLGDLISLDRAPVTVSLRGRSLILETGVPFEGLPDYLVATPGNGTQSARALAKAQGLDQNPVRARFEGGTIVVEEFEDKFAGGQPPYHALVLDAESLVLQSIKEYTGD